MLKRYAEQNRGLTKEKKDAIKHAKIIKKMPFNGSSRAKENMSKQPGIRLKET